MITATQIIRTHSPTTELARLSVLDRLALHLGVALIQHAARQPARIVRNTSRSDVAAQRRELVEARHRIGLVS